MNNKVNYKIAPPPMPKFLAVAILAMFRHGLPAGWGKK